MNFDHGCVKHCRDFLFVSSLPALSQQWFAVSGVSVCDRTEMTKNDSLKKTYSTVTAEHDNTKQNSTYQTVSLNKYYQLLHSEDCSIRACLKSMFGKRGVDDGGKKRLITIAVVFWPT